MKLTRTELVTAMANITMVRIRDWADDNLPASYKARIVVRARDAHVETTIQRYHEKTKTWSTATFIFPGAASDGMISDVLHHMVNELASKV